MRSRSRAVDRSTSRELREPSLEGAQSSRRRGRLRGESGQAAVEFALVVPLLCLIIIAILHFGKVMNYWLDLNHVASEGARKAAVNTFASDAEYDAYLRGRLETGELRTGGTTSIPTPSTVAVCLPEGSDVGDPVTVQVAVGLQPALHRHDDHAPGHGHDAARAACRLRGRRGVHVSATRGIADLASREDGGIVVFVALLMPVVLLFLALTVDIGNWWVHKRHLQLQVDAAALAGGALFGGCFTDSGSREHGDPERGDAVRRRRRLELQRPGRRREQGDDHAPLPEQDVRRRLRRARRHRDAAPVRHAEPDVRRQGERGRACRSSSRFRASPRSTAINAHARVQLKQVEVQEGMLPVAVPDLRFTYVFATFVNEATGASLGTVQLHEDRHERQRPALDDASRDPRLDRFGARRRPAPPRRRRRSERRLRHSSTQSATTSTRPNGVVHIRGWSTAPRRRLATRGSCPGSCVPDAYFATGDCSGGIQAEVDLGATLSSRPAPA